MGRDFIEEDRKEITYIQFLLRNLTNLGLSDTDIKILEDRREQIVDSLKALHRTITDEEISHILDKYAQGYEYSLNYQLDINNIQKATRSVKKRDLYQPFNGYTLEEIKEYLTKFKNPNSILAKAVPYYDKLKEQYKTISDGKRFPYRINKTPMPKTLVDPLDPTTIEAAREAAGGIGVK